MQRFLSIMLLGAGLAATSAFGATILTYTDVGSFNASSIVGGGPTYTEDFNTNASLYTTFTAVGFDAAFTPGFSGGMRNTRVSATYSEAITLNSGNMTAFAGTWDLSPGFGLGGGVSIQITFADNSTQIVTLSSGPNAGQNALLGYNVGNGVGSFFFGFTSDVAFTTVTLISGQAGGQWPETFNLDDVLVEQAGGGGGGGGGAVPEPSTFALMGLAMSGLGLIRRVRK